MKTIKGLNDAILIMSSLGIIIMLILLFIQGAVGFVIYIYNYIFTTFGMYLLYFIITFIITLLITVFITKKDNL